MDFGGGCGNFPRLVCEIGIDFMDLFIYMILKLLPRQITYLEIFFFFFYLALLPAYQI